jgi:hypothetical protein
MKISILDFDQTVTVDHTFSKNCLDAMLEMTPAQRMAKGAADAQSNIKVGISSEQAPFKFSGDQMFCIATYHNNPDYIMGYLSVMLGKKITAGQTMSDDVHGIAIRECFVEGSDKPLLLSYLPKLGAEFQTTMSKLHGKNEQIAQLRGVLESGGHLQADDVCDFYDDSQPNIAAAANIFNIRAHQVSREAQFRVTATQEARIAPSVQAVVAHQVEDLHFSPVPAPEVMVAKVTIADLMATGIAKAMNRQQAEQYVADTGKSVLRTASVGGLALTTKSGNHLISDDMKTNPQGYQTLEGALQRLESFGVDISGALLPEKPVTLDDIRSWGLVQNLNRAQAEAAVAGTTNAVLREASVGGLAMTQGHGQKAATNMLIADDMRDNPGHYKSKEKALARFVSAGVDVSAVYALVGASAVGMFAGSARAASRAAAQPVEQVDQTKKAQQ